MKVNIHIAVGISKDFERVRVAGGWIMTRSEEVRLGGVNR